MPLADPVADLVHDGDTVAFEGFTHLRHQMRAFVERVDFVTSVGHGSGRRTARSSDCTGQDRSR